MRCIFLKKEGDTGTIYLRIGKDGSDRRVEMISRSDSEVEKWEISVRHLCLRKESDQYTLEQILKNTALTSRSNWIKALGRLSEENSIKTDDLLEWVMRSKSR